jgi:hypothetical protein
MNAPLPSPRRARSALRKGVKNFKEARYFCDLSSSANSHIQCKLKCNMKVSVSWDTTTLSRLKVNRCFGGTCHLHLRRRRISQARTLLATCFHAGFLLGLLLDPEDGGDIHPVRHPGMKFLNVLIKTRSHNRRLVGLVFPRVRKYRF